MHWLTTIWTSFITLSLALSGFYLVRWLRQREWLYIFFVLLGVSIAAQAASEIWMFRAASVEEYGLALRWFQVPIFFAFCMVVGIIHLRFNTGRLWLGLFACGMRFVSLIINFVQDPNLNYVALTSIDTITLLGESVTTAQGESSPWMLTAQIALIALLAYILDAAISSWRRERNMRAVVFCGALALLVLVGTVQGILIFWEIIQTPMLAAPFFIGVTLVMAVEVGMELLRTEQLDEALKESKTQLERVSQAAAMSELSGALAHEINQPLGIILSNAEAASIMLKSEHPDIDELRDIVGDIISADRRAADVISRLRSLLQRGEPNLKDCDLNAAVEEAIGHLANKFRTQGVSLQRTLDKELPLVKADRILLVQVLLNLLGNARDAVSQNPAGERIVKIQTLANDQYLVVNIEDNGGGLTGNTDRIFDAFVTTKENGLGMGLAIAKSIVEAHDGKISANPIAGPGTLLRVSIPRKYVL
jgi:signal transduction histidine kinase